MAWIWEVWETIKAALGVRRYLVFGWISGGVTLVAAILLHFWGERLTIFGTVLIGLLIVTGLLSVFMTHYALSLRRGLRPDLVLTCADPGCVVEGPLQYLDQKGSA